MLRLDRPLALSPLVAGLAVLLVAAPARAAAVTVYSDNAQSCYKAAKFGDPFGTGISDCDDAMIGMARSDHDYAGSLVNRGVVYLYHNQFNHARADFDAALQLNPNMGDAYANRGAALIGMRRFADGIADINRGLPLGPDEPEKAYYNRALAEEFLDDEKAAYFDYLKAEQLQPNWDAPRRELTRFTVTEK
jgi:tetratricopeptide (TPR) repeat protein